MLGAASGAKSGVSGMRGMVSVDEVVGGLNRAILEEGSVSIGSNVE